MREKKNGVDPRKLEELVGKIKESHEQCVMSLRTSLAYARKTGGYLIEVQKLLQASDTKWIPWVQENCPFSISEAQRFVRIANNYFKLLEKCDDPDRLTMTEALLLLSPAEKKVGTAKDKSSQPFTASSPLELKEKEHDAEFVQFADDSRERAFVRKKAAVLAQQILSMAKVSKMKDTNGHRVESMQVAIALVQQLRLMITPSLVVEVTKPDISSKPANAKKSSGTGPKPVNLSNGVPALAT